MTTADVAPAPQGLTDDEVAERRERGQTNDVATATSRKVSDIVRANVFTPFNFLLGGLLAVIVVVGPLNDALFGGVLIANALIGIVQELRAKRTLDRLAVLSAPRARVVRAGEQREIDVAEVVLDDVLELTPGDQVVVDGEVLATRGLEIDESLLTGESDPVVKVVGDEVLSGSFVAAGSGYCRATRVGPDAYAAKLAAEARRFAHDAVGVAQRHRPHRAPRRLGHGADRRPPADHPAPPASHRLQGSRLGHRRRRGGHGARGTRPAHQHRVCGRRGAARPASGTGAGAVGGRDPGAGRRGVPRQDRNVDVGRHQLRSDRTSRRRRRRGGHRRHRRHRGVGPEPQCHPEGGGRRR